jgi:SAM-dependent methyltransferase
MFGMAPGAVVFESADVDAYDRLVGRYAPPLARAHARLLRLRKGHDVLEIGCRTGALTEALASVVGARRVSGVEPFEPFAEACRARVPGADIRIATAEEIPDFGRVFAVATSQLVLNVVTDADATVRTMSQAVRAGGTVASVVWDYRGGMTLLRAFWDAALERDPGAPDEGRTVPHCTTGGLRALWLRAGLSDVRTGEIVVEAHYADFDDLWAPFTAGIGPAGAYYGSLDTERREALRSRYSARLGNPDGSLTLAARAWFVRGTVGES